MNKHPHWRWRYQNNPDAYQAAADAYYNAIKNGRAEHAADDLAEEAAAALTANPNPKR
jgi:hypothetical protein